ncbi:AzlC family ABC transporter permease [Haloarchaeobius baliensis]|uniref:AzlC family ABC transporter permease n=1 Tax=Haloarchaeobius baliensis TaxID=1670458 RepID=UPI003F880761
MTSTARSAFRDGARAVLPALPANVPFGLVVGVAAANLGLHPVTALWTAALLFAGAAQLAMIELLARDAPVVVAVLTAIVVNLRYAMYSAGLAPYVRSVSRGWRLVLSFFLLDVTYALSLPTFRADETVDRRAYYLGIAVPLWLTWSLSVGVGASLGTGLPPGWHLEFAIPLLFLALLVPNVRDRGGVVAAVVGGVGAVAGLGIPFDLGLVVAALAGVGIGLVADPDGADDEDSDDAEQTPEKPPDSTEGEP